MSGKNKKYKVSLLLAIFIALAGGVYSYSSFFKMAPKPSESAVANIIDSTQLSLNSLPPNSVGSRNPANQLPSKKEPAVTSIKNALNIVEQASFEELVRVLQTKKSTDKWTISVFPQENNKVQISGGELKINSEQQKNQIQELTTEIIKITAPGLVVSTQIADPIESDVLQTYKVGLMLENTEVIGAEVSFMVLREARQITLIQTEELKLGEVINSIKINQNEAIDLVKEKYQNRNPKIKLSEKVKIYIKPPNTALYVWEAISVLHQPEESYLDLINAESGIIENSYRTSIHENN